MSRRIVAFATSAMLVAGCSASRAPEAVPATPEASASTIPYNPDRVLPHIGSIVLDEQRIKNAEQQVFSWVTVMRRNTPETHPDCYLDMRHVLDGRNITDTLGNTIGRLCEEGDVVLPGELPEGFAAALEQNRAFWGKLLKDVTAELQNGGNDVDATVSNRVVRVDRVGTAYPALALNDGGGGRDFGPQTCFLFADDRLRLVGSVTWYENNYTVGVVGPPGSTGSPCDEGDIVLLHYGQQV